MANIGKWIPVAILAIAFASWAGIELADIRQRMTEAMNMENGDSPFVGAPGDGDGGDEPRFHIMPWPYSERFN